MLKVGLILYSVRGEMERDPIGAVETVAKMGYKNIEVCNHNAIHDPGCGFHVGAPELKAAFDRFGAKVVSAHVFPFEKSDMQAVIAYNQALGNRNIVNPMGRFSTYDDLMRQCEDFNRWGKVCREEGMTYLYHNHDHEFKTFGGKAILDLIAENTDPDYLSFELDTFWTMRGGVDPAEQMKKMGSRIKLLHQKDFAWDSMAPLNTIGLTPEEREMQGEVGMDGNSDYAKSGGRFSAEAENEQRRIRNTAFTEIGSGIMHIQEIIDAANRYTGAQYIILEQDYTRMENQFASVEKSMAGFKKFTGISWDAE